MVVTVVETKSRPHLLEMILSVSVVELLLTLADCIMYGKNIWEERQSKNSLVGAWLSNFSGFKLKSPSRQNNWFSSEILSSKGLNELCVCVCLFLSTVEASLYRNKTIDVMPEIRPAMLCWGNHFASSTFITIS